MTTQAYVRPTMGGACNDGPVHFASVYGFAVVGRDLTLDAVHARSFNGKSRRSHILARSPSSVLGSCHLCRLCAPQKPQYAS